MARLLFRIGGLLIIGSIVYLAVAESMGPGADNDLVQKFLIAGVLCIAGGTVLWAAGRVISGAARRGCPRCGRAVARGRVYCEEHLAETINEYRDEQRRRKE